MSDFRRKKLEHVFKVFFDVDGSGHINKDDFEEALKRISTSKGWSEGSEQYEDLKKRLDSVWEGLQKAADDDGDGDVTLEEWCSLWDKFAADQASVSSWQDDYRDLIYHIMDSSEDGTVDKEEFCSVCDIYGVAREDSEAAYKLIAKAGGEMTREEFGKYWLEYFTSDDEKAAGNFIFGKISF